MRKTAGFLAVLLIAGGCSKSPEAPSVKTPSKAAGHVAPSGADDEKAKAMAEPYANDYGPESLDVSGYPKEIQAGYALMVNKCSTCHSAARPLNSQFVQTAGKKKKDRKAALSALKKSDPDLFKDKIIWQVEEDIWNRYTKRMMNKPGCDISKEERKGIYKFLAHDSRIRKLGKNKARWRDHRKKLLAKIKEEHPKRYEVLYGEK